MPTCFLQSIIISLCTFFFMKIILSLCTRNKKLPPSPPSIPIIGHLHLIKTPLHHSLARISQKYGPATFLRFGSRPVLVISSKSLAEQCLTTLSFANRPQMPTAKHTTFDFTMFVFANYGPYLTTARRICAGELLSAESMKASTNFRAREVQGIAHQLFRSWKTCIGSDYSSNGLKKLEMKTVLFELVLNVLMTMIGGKRFYDDDIGDMDDVKRFREGVEETFSLSDVSNIEDFIPVFKLLDLRGVIKKTAKLAEQNKEMMRQLIEEHRQNSGEKKETMIAHLLGMQKEDSEVCKDETIQAICMVRM